MQLGTMWKFSILLLIFGFLLSCFACVSDNQDEDEDSKWTVKNIIVQKDDVYNFKVGERIGQVKFRKYRGAVGSRVNMVVRIDQLSQLDDRKANVRFELINQDALRIPFEADEWVQDGNEKTTYFIIPLVETVPVILDFRLVIYEADGSADDDDDDSGDDDDNDASDDDDDNDAADDDDDDDVATSATDAELAGFGFVSWADFLFVVSEGTPGTGD